MHIIGFWEFIIYFHYCLLSMLFGKHTLQLFLVSKKKVGLTLKFNSSFFSHNLAAIIQLNNFLTWVYKGLSLCLCVSLGPHLVSFKSYSLLSAYRLLQCLLGDHVVLCIGAKAAAWEGLAHCGILNLKLHKFSAMFS